MDAPFEVLVLCTGNICRSPMAEALLRARLHERGIPAHVSSAGITFEGRAATDEAIDAAARYGLDLSHHRSRVVTPQLASTADLVIGMERLHTREVAVMGSSLFGRCFTLKELVRRGELAGARRHDEAVPDWLRHVGMGRRPMDLLGESPIDDVADPYLGSPKVYAGCIAELDDLVRRLVDLVWPVAREGVA